MSFAPIYVGFFSVNGVPTNLNDGLADAIFDGYIADGGLPDDDTYANTFDGGLPDD